MKKIFASLLAVGALGASAYGQCANDNVFWTTLTATTVGVPSSTTCMYGGEYVNVNVVAGSTYRFSTCGDPDFDTQITLYNSAGGGALGYNDDFCGLQSQIDWNATFTGTLRVLVDRFFCTNQNSCMTLTATRLTGGAPSGNDVCGGAIPVAVGSSTSGSTASATVDAGLPFCGTSGGTAPGVWYSFVGTGGLVNINTCNAVGYDSKLHVFTGSCGSLSCVAGNDDDFSSCSFSGLRSRVDICTTPGTVYYVLVHGFGSGSGSFVLNVNPGTASVSISPVANQCVTGGSVFLSGTPAGGTFSGAGVSGSTFSPAAAGVGTHTLTYTFCGVSASTSVTVLPAPSNDLCSGAITIGPGSVSGNTTCASIDGGLPFCGTSGGSANGVWYTFVGDGRLWDFTTCNAGTNYDTKLHAFTGSACSGFACVAGNDDMGSACATGPGVASFKSRISFCTTIGQRYYILVHGFGSGTGSFQLDVTATTTVSVNAGPNTTVIFGYPSPMNCTDLTATISGGTGPYSILWSTGATTATINVCPSVTTDYTVTVTDANGCQSTDVVRVCVVDVRCGSDLSKIAVCHYPPGNPAARHTICIGYPAVDNHLSLHGDELGPCGAVSAACEDAGSTEKMASAVSKLSAAPNPFSTSTSIEFTLGSSDEASLKVYDLSGALIATLFEGSVTAGEKMAVEFGSTDLAAGIYMARLVTNGGEVQTVKLVIQK